MKRNSKYLELAGIFLVSILSAIISSYYLEGDSALIIGVSAFVLLSLSILQMRIAMAEERLGKLGEVLGSVIGKSSFREVLLKHTLAVVENVHEDGISSSGDNYWNLWLDCISSCQKSWIVTNYAKVDDVWSLSFSDRVTGIQRGMILRGQKVSRIFIFDSFEEKKAAHTILNKQFDEGIEVSWIIKKDIPSNHTIKNLIQKVGTIDFAIVDDNWLMRAYLDRGRKVKSLNATDNNGLTQNAKHLMDEFVKLSTKYQLADKTDVPETK